MTPLQHVTAAVGLAALLQGCASTDPLLNANDWHPTGANDSNIAAEVVNPNDLVYGRRATGGSDGQLAASAVQRLRTNHLKPLPDTGLTDLHLQAVPSGGASP